MGPMKWGNLSNQTVVLPIVDPATLVADTDAPILGFIAFHITGYSQGGQYIEGYFDKEYVITNPQGIGLPNPNIPSTPPLRSWFTEVISGDFPDEPPMPVSSSARRRPGDGAGLVP